MAECNNIVAAVTPKYPIPLSASTPGSPGIFCDLGVHLPALTSYDTVFIYGVVGQHEQDEIAGTLNDFRRASHTRRILLQFFEKENWKMWSDPKTGSGGGARGPETPIRKVWIK